MTRTVQFDPRVQARRDLANMRKLVKPARGPLARVWAWLNTPVTKG